jgi:hypothetical protein
MHVCGFVAAVCLGSADRFSGGSMSVSVEFCPIVAEARMQEALREQRRLRAAIIVMEAKYWRVNRGLLHPMTLVHRGQGSHSCLSMCFPVTRVFRGLLHMA